jgi:FKBP-type peptidyl-prolyl cis-trans isomerase FklB
MTFKRPPLALTAIALSAVIFAASCQNADNSTEAVKSENIVYDCPTDKVFTTIAPYGEDTAAPEMGTNFTSYHVENSKRDDVMTSTTGLQYKVVQAGLSDGAQPVGDQEVTMHYHGYYPDGRQFDSSYERGETITYPATGFIKGWIESLHDMKVCEARILYIPGDLAYGPQGRGPIAPNATLLFKMQLIGVTPAATQ